MTVFEIRIQPELLEWNQKTVLDGIEFEFQFRYQARAGSWYVRLFDTEGTAVTHAMRLSTDSYLATELNRTNRPPGEIYVLGRDDSDDDPSSTDLDDRVGLIYLDAAEVAAALA